ncbi:hypothetical protein SIN8267_01509 [Sinobacterium norvegicum]|uniref:DUF962 domain-containing protein n=1 Tax=Sinobacterium norvegicum TaxID=1641715 RepID=A0ABM9ADW6_9GAMM|nr:Mpo1-like protein [Sinobacterium norvegicum]CAH0991405.1 hypothetical protein SIN8267_01509 [Sinobacterium norvegicum]
MRTATSWFEEYSQSHQNITNKRIHNIAVPTIYFSIAGLLWGLPQPGWMASVELLNWTSLTLFFVMIFYATLGLRFFIALLVFSLSCLLLSWAIEMATGALTVISVSLFVIAWIAQFYGHKVEGKKPSFFKDILFLLVGPAWVFDGFWKNKK